MIKKILYILTFIIPVFSYAENITIIVPFPPGGAYDIVARKFAKFVAEETSTPTVVINVLGAGGYVGIQKLTSSPPNTLLITSSSLYTNLKNYQIPLETFKYVSILADAPYFLIGSIKNNITCEKLRNDSKIFFVGTAGKNSASSIPLYMIQEKYKNFEEVPYKGTVTAITDVLSGQIDLTLITGLFHNRPDINIIANTSEKTFEGIPSIKKCLGINKTINSNFIVIANKNSDNEFVSRINELSTKFTETNDTKTYFTTYGLVSKTKNLLETYKLIKLEYESANLLLNPE
jgi:tripartite-type tricarboxylate transporter receptor subunit TctC